LGHVYQIPGNKVFLPFFEGLWFFSDITCFIKAYLISRSFSDFGISAVWVAIYLCVWVYTRLPEQTSNLRGHVKNLQL